MVTSHWWGFFLLNLQPSQSCACVRQCTEARGAGPDTLTQTEWDYLLRQQHTQCLTSFYVLRGLEIYFIVSSWDCWAVNATMAGCQSLHWNGRASPGRLWHTQLSPFTDEPVQKLRRWKYNMAKTCCWGDTAWCIHCPSLNSVLFKLCLYLFSIFFNKMYPLSLCVFCSTERTRMLRPYMERITRHSTVEYGNNSRFSDSLSWGEFIEIVVSRIKEDIS